MWLDVVSLICEKAITCLLFHAINFDILILTSQASVFRRVKSAKIVETRTGYVWSNVITFLQSTDVDARPRFEVRLIPQLFAVSRLIYVLLHQHGYQNDDRILLGLGFQLLGFFSNIDTHMKI